MANKKKARTRRFRAVLPFSCARSGTPDRRMPSDKRMLSVCGFLFGNREFILLIRVSLAIDTSLQLYGFVPAGYAQITVQPGITVFHILLQ